MLTDTLSLLDQTIENLHTLSGVFDDERDSKYPSGGDTEARLIEDARFAIERLLPTLQAARITQIPPETRHRAPYCIDCD
ncbi:MAG: hypothetical protein QM808_17755 [Steroidobacteraceae bacterium]